MLADRDTLDPIPAAPCRLVAPDHRDLWDFVEHLSAAGTPFACSLSPGK